VCRARRDTAPREGAGARAARAPARRHLRGPQPRGACSRAGRGCCGRCRRQERARLPSHRAAPGTRTALGASVPAAPRRSRRPCVRRLGPRKRRRAAARATITPRRAATFPRLVMPMRSHSRPQTGALAACTAPLRGRESPARRALARRIAPKEKKRKKAARKKEVSHAPTA
jgi:hypothetical protein